jgi:hypothetical protein
MRKTRLTAVAAWGMLILTPVSTAAAASDRLDGATAVEGFAPSAGQTPTNGGTSDGVSDEVITEGAPSAMSIARPTVAGRNVFVSQIGNRNTASVQQGAKSALARVIQDGDNNFASVAQHGSAATYADVQQSGVDHVASVAQAGIGGGNTLFLTQNGGGNSANAVQTSAGAVANGAVLAQSGSGNVMTLMQDGSDNLAQLSQNGVGSAMTASQSGEGNRLIWAQVGDGLSNLAIAQRGGGSLQITQSR